MSLSQQLALKIAQARKARQSEVVSALSLLAAKLKNAQIDKGQDLKPQEELSVVQKQIKLVAESAQAFKQAGRNQAAQKELSELAILKQFLPQPLDPRELKQIVNQTLKSQGFSQKNQLGPAIAACLKIVQGRADSAQVAQLVKLRLNIE